MRKTRMLQATAYHEAGHAVVAHLEGIRVKGVSVLPDENTSGRIHHANPLAGINLEWDGSWRATKRAESLIRVCLAGAISQKRFSPHGYRKYHASTDHEQAADMVLRISGSSEEANAYLKLLRIQTSQKLNHWWPLVEAVAGAVLEHGELSAKEIRAVICSSRESRFKLA